MKKWVFLLIVFFAPISYLCAQGFSYDERTQLSENLFKVKSGDFYGIIDGDENVVVSVEYQNIRFREGKALLIKDDYIVGVVDTKGHITPIEGEYKVYPEFPYVYEGVIPVICQLSGGTNKYGFIDTEGNPLRMNTKIKGSRSIGKNYPTLFDDVTPFVDNYACVYLNKYGWKHIGKEGIEYFMLDDKNDFVQFRSSVYNGECIIATASGIRQCQLKKNNYAAVKRNLTSSAEMISDFDAITRKIRFQEGVLTLDSLRRVVKFETANDSILFIKKPRKVVVQKVVEPVDTLSLEEDLTFRMAYSSTKANAKGRANSKIVISNLAREDFKNVEISLSCQGEEKEWKGNLLSESDFDISFNIPARFSVASVRRSIIMKVKYKKQTIEKTFDLTVRRYTPVRSR